MQWRQFACNVQYFWTILYHLESLGIAWLGWFNTQHYLISGKWHHWLWYTMSEKYSKFLFTFYAKMLTPYVWPVEELRVYIDPNLAAQCTLFYQQPHEYNDGSMERIDFLSLINCIFLHTTKIAIKITNIAVFIIAEFHSCGQYSTHGHGAYFASCWWSLHVFIFNQTCLIILGISVELTFSNSKPRYRTYRIVWYSKNIAIRLFLLSRCITRSTRNTLPYVTLVLY